MRINQFHSGTASGDAITNQMLAIQKILLDAGYESEIYAEHIDLSLSKKIRNISGYKGNESSILLVHHSMGFDRFEQIVSLPDTKILIYHNITPERFFTDETIRKYIRLGLWQAREYKKYVKYAIADSNYNRRELIHMGYKNVDVMPVQISLDRFEHIEADRGIIENLKEKKTLLFVGRLVPNKCQSDVIRAFSIYEKYFNANSNLVLPGDLSNYSYVEALRQLCRKLEIERKVIFPGKVSEAELKAYYEAADIFLCMSEHEGFGVPLLEAMTFGIPVVAYRSSAIAETMGGAGVLVVEKDMPMTGALIDEIIENRQLHDGIVNRQYTRIKELEQTDTRKILMKAIGNTINQKRVRSIQMQGPFETSYSLAIVNRRLMEAMDDIGKEDISIYCTEGPGDYQPREADLKDKPHARRLWEKSKEVLYPDVTIRNMYPPRVADANGGLNFLAFGWEESRIPQKYVKDFNQYLDGIGTMSDFVTDSLIQSGVRIPVKTMGLGVELIDGFDSIAPYRLKTKKGIKFLHISSAFPRKGVDLLLKAYYETFTGADDVCLVIKTFPNPHNTVERQLAALRSQYPEGPEVELINKDLLPKQLYGLYKVADCYVTAARGEGFGLPVAEAMLARVPVIVSPNTGMADFCNDSTAFLVDYKMEKANTHLTTAGSQWALPNTETLGRLLKQFANGELDVEAAVRKENAYHLISEKYTWHEVAKRWEEFIAEVEELQEKPKVAMVTSWNNKCGIAEFTRMQCEAMQSRVEFRIYPNYGVRLLKPDEPNVEHRVWHSAFKGDLIALKNALDQSDCEVVHFQFNFGFFDLQQLSDLIDYFYGKKRIVITFHKTKDTDVGGKKASLRKIVSSLNKCYRLVVHQDEDEKVLLKFGVKQELIQKIPLGQIVYPDEEKKSVRAQLEISGQVVLGSYGFLLPQKGILENIRALPALKEKYNDILYLVVCALHESEVSKHYLADCKKAVEKLHLQENVRFVTDYLSNEESVRYLHACDVLLMTYLPSMESASGAIRLCIAAQRPVITTKQEIFEEFADCTWQIKENAPGMVAEAVWKMLDKTVEQEYLQKIKDRIAETNWEKTSKKYLEIYKGDL